MWVLLIISGKWEVLVGLQLILSQESQVWGWLMLVGLQHSQLRNEYSWTLTIREANYIKKIHSRDTFLNSRSSKYSILSSTFAFPFGYFKLSLFLLNLKVWGWRIVAINITECEQWTMSSNQSNQSHQHQHHSSQYFNANFLSSHSLSQLPAEGSFNLEDTDFYSQSWEGAVDLSKTFLHFFLILTVCEEACLCVIDLSIIPARCHQCSIISRDMSATLSSHISSTSSSSAGT